MRRTARDMASSSSSTSRSKRRVPVMRQAKREEEYEVPTRYCHHGFVAPRWTAWTEGNPGRRFYGCRKYNKDDGCGYFEWHDSEFGERANEVIKELLEENRELQKKKDSEWFYEEVDSIERKVATLKRRREMEESKLKTSEMKLKIAMVTLLVTWGWLFYIYFRI